MRNHFSTAATIAALALTVPFAGVALANDENRGKGDERPQTAPGQEKKAAHAAPQSAHSQNGKGYGAGKSTKPAKKPKKAKRAKPAAPKPANSHAKAGKTTICHSTGSETNPYVRITVSNNALKAHARHHDGRDLIPAPAEGCPKGETKTGAPPAKPAKVTICHATGSEKNPFVKITIAESAVAAHRRHQDGRDIIPAPEGDCPATAPAPSAAARAARTDASAALPAPATALAAPRGNVLGEFASGGAPSVAQPGGDVLAAGAGNDRRESGADPGVSASLPFTGLDTWLMVLAGLGLLLAGVAGRRAASHRA